MNVSDDIKNTLRRIDEAAAAVEEAKKADQAAKDALAKANNNGLITPTEVETLNAAQQNAVAKKTAATNIVNQLPAAYKGDMPTTLAGLTGIDIPSVTDQNENGIADDYEAALTAVEAAMTAVEAAMTADEDVKAELVKANEDGLITPTEKAELERLQQDVVDKKAAAEEIVNALQEDQKGILPAELEKLEGITIPKVNDSDANGVDDEVDAQRKEAEAAVEAAKVADQAAKDALAELSKDGLITPTEKAELERLQQEAVEKKEAATEKVNVLPEKQKGDMPTTLAGLTGIDIPSVTDQNENGIADDYEAALTAVEAAMTADEDVKAELVKANEDGLITPTEKAELERLQQDVVDKKAAAEEIVNALQEDQKGILPAELEKLEGITIPKVNDSDANGVDDEVDAQRDAAKAAVEEAKVADQAAKDALAELSKDGLITPEEKKGLEKLQQAAVDKKAEATDKVEALPADQKGELPTELSKLDGIEIPDINDNDANGVADEVDEQRKEAKAAVEAAKVLDQAAKDTLAELSKGGLITPEEKKGLEKLQQAAVDKKAEATDKVEALPADQKGELPTELSKLDGIEIPDINDNDANGVADEVDEQRKEAKAAVEAAKVLDQAAKDTLAELSKDGLITPEEKKGLEKLQQAAVDKKAEATDKVEALPADQKGELPTELSKLDGIEIPDINDNDANGVDDEVDEQRKEAEAAVEAAKVADQAAKDVLAELSKDGLITPTEKSELERLQQEAVEKKEAATEKVNVLPEKQKGDMPTTLAGLTGIDIPSVTDQNENGIADDFEAALTAVEAAMTADEDVKAELVKANEDGLITPTEKAELERLQQDVVDKKAAAEEIVNALQEDQKGILPAELEKLEGITIPKVNDSDANGVDDEVDAQRDAAKAAVEEAKVADQAAKDALAELSKDGLITPEEKKGLEKLQQAAVDKKTEATDKVEALPAEQKGELPTELSKLDGIEIPDINDNDANGVADEVDEQRKEAKAAVEAAKVLDQAAKDTLAELSKDGLITPEEKKGLEKLQQAAVDKKAEATDKVEALPADQKGELPTELSKLDGIEIPDINDNDANGVADEVDAQRKEAEAAVEAAKQADEAAKTALAELSKDGLITPADKAELERLQQEATAKKAEATDKVEALPADQKGELPTELSKLDGIEIPDINDNDANGVADEVDEQRKEAEAAVEAAKQADEAAKTALAELSKDGLITPADKAELERLQQEAADKKATATEKVEALPADQKGELPSELDKLDGIEIPKVTDADENGIDDDTDAQRADAEKAVEEAKKADQAAKDALAKANEDGLITPTEKAELEKLQQDATDKKAAATEKVDALPADQKGDLPSELDKLDGITIPEINDKDENGIADDTDAQKADAEKAVEAAKKADQAAKDALAKANEDGLITPTEKAELEKLQQDAADKKAAATEKVDALPEDQKGNLPSELDKLDGITIPEVNDSDENGIADNVDAQRADAEKAVEEAKKADKAAKDALAKAQADGIITAEERAELERLQKDAQVKKATATEKVEALPADQKGDLLEELDKLTGIKVPEVTDIGDSDKPGDHSDTENKPGKDTKSGDKQEKPDGTISSPMKPTEKDNDTITEDGETIEKETPSQIDSEGKKQTLHELPKTGQDSQQPITLFGGLITALGGLLFFRRRKKEKESK
ncbi:LPXTG cell wall anchor domain-containing protein [Staphylococcus sp. IVB6214]|uniref:GA-like domain-containing protein n=1 Tax=Staphylococcus sp. IVB6214 TaxID=2989766 RepID=UPI0021D2E343|nr:LPXTG cell wall anchor domain-containing protein [Staphylococcus sp. IVB6214]UXR82649.1 LPXTG cell wall anchor domain-containing protein [Staphylococcus sp. IVB6214]